VDRLTISCETCERLWTLGCALSVYEQQALESRPCPHCGAYTLTVHKPEELIGAGTVRTWSTFAP
jgi:Zn finger protein HypA/HybF involved in hydrogenase expression